MSDVAARALVFSWNLGGVRGLGRSSRWFVSLSGWLRGKKVPKNVIFSDPDGSALGATFSGHSMRGSIIFFLFFADLEGCPGWCATISGSKKYFFLKISPRGILHRKT